MAILSGFNPTRSITWPSQPPGFTATPDFLCRQAMECRRKTVLEVIVEPSQAKPHFAKDENGKWIAWVRHHDENRLASRVMIEVWRKQKSRDGILVHLDDSWKFLLEYLYKYDFITVSALARKGCLPYRKAEQLLADGIVTGIIQPFSGRLMSFTN